MTNWVYRDSDDSGFFSIEFGWSRLSDNAVILQSGESPACDTDAAGALGDAFRSTPFELSLMLRAAPAGWYRATGMRSRHFQNV
jgi:hypothetical protein